MELINLAYAAQIAAFVGLFAYLWAAYAQVRLERRVDRLMTTEVSDDLLSDEQRGTRFRHGGGEQLGGATEWEMLSWDDKMHYMNRQQTLNWAAAVAGVITVLGGIIWGWAEVRHDWDEGLGVVWLAVLSGLFLLGAGYLGWVHYTRWKRARGDYLRMKGR